MTGCAYLGAPTSASALTKTTAVSVTQAMINNGGFVFVIGWGTRNDQLFVVYGQWVVLQTAGPGITLSRSTALPVAEGSTATYTVKLATAPTGGVRVQVSSSNTEVKVKTGSGSAATSINLDFNATTWNDTQTVTVSADSDTDAAADTATLTHSIDTANTVTDYDTVSSKTLTVNVADDDGEIVVSQSTTLTVAEGSSGTYNVKLRGQPASDVVVRVSSGDGGAVSVNKTGGTAGASQDLTFTNSDWNTNQVVTLTGEQDDDTGDESVTITHTVVDASSSDEFDGASDVTFTAAVTDDESVEVTVSAVSGQATEAGGTATFTVKLGSKPTANVTISVTSEDTGEGTVSPSSLTFEPDNTNSKIWSSAQTITVTGVDDSIADGDADLQHHAGVAYEHGHGLQRSFVADGEREHDGQRQSGDNGERGERPGNGGGGNGHVHGETRHAAYGERDYICNQRGHWRGDGVAFFAYVRAGQHEQQDMEFDADGYGDGSGRQSGRRDADLQHHAGVADEHGHGLQRSFVADGGP